MPPYFSMKERYSGILMVPVKINWNAVWDLGTGLKYNRRNSFHKPADEIMFLVFLTDNAIIHRQFFFRIHRKNEKIFQMVRKIKIRKDRGSVSASREERCFMDIFTNNVKICLRIQGKFFLKLISILKWDQFWMQCRSEFPSFKSSKVRDFLFFNGESFGRRTKVREWRSL